MTAKRSNPPQQPVQREASLDPEDWDAFRETGRRLVDEMASWLENVRERPVWRRPPTAVRDRLTGPLPEAGIGLDAALQDFRTDVLPFPLGNTHPRFWGWVVGSGDPVGVLGELLAAAMNPNVFAGDNAATLVEAQVIAWSRDLLGLPEEGSGVLTNGCAIANLTGLAIARHARVGADWSGVGLAGLDALPILYCSTETHNSVDKAARLLGLGAAALRRIPAAGFEMDVAALRQAILGDLAEGRAPFCIVANVGTVNTGAIDPLEAIADLADAHGLWLHLDGAFGAWAALTDEYRPRLAAMARADSIAFDFHKWMYAPYAAACLLTRHPELHRAAFSAEGAYLATDSRGLMSGRPGFGSLGIELGRDFRALKLWLSLKAHGRDTFRALIERNIAQARHLAARIDAAAGLALCAPVPLNIVCFRAVAPDRDEAALDAVNREIMLRLQESGAAIVSSTVINGRFVLRAAITNHRSRFEDFDLLIDEVLRHREAILKEGPSP